MKYKGIKSDKNKQLDMWSSFHKRLEKKFKGNFGKDCWLVIYHNIRYSDITPYGVWHNTLLANMENIELFKI